MRANVILWNVVGAFFFVMAVIYTIWCLIPHPDLPWNFGGVEWVGTIGMFFIALMSWLISFYLSRVHRAQQGELPEDVLTADIDDGDPELGEFSPWSWWPMVLAGSAAIAAIGFSIGSWMVPIGILVFAVAIVGWVFEYYRGHFAR